MFDKLTRRDIANDPRWTKHYVPESLPVMLNQSPDMPELQPCMRAGGQYLYDPGDVDKWFVRLEKWIDERPAREAAGKADAERRFWDRWHAEQARIKSEFEVLNQQLEATKQRMAEVERQNKVNSPVTPWR